MPNRILRDWTDSYRVEALTAAGERMFVRLIMKVDDHGRFHADPRLVKSACFPLLTVPDTHVGRWLDELDAAGLIVRYEVAGRKCLSICGFAQRLRAKRAKFPPPDGQPDDWSPSNDGHMTVIRQTDGGRVTVNRPPESESESESESEEKRKTPAAPVAFDRFWGSYPKKVGKQEARKVWELGKLDSKLDPIMAALEWQTKSQGWRDEGGRFIPNPATWLRQGRWEDEPIKAIRAPAPQGDQDRRNAHYRAVRDIVAAGREARAATDAPGDWERWRAAALDKYRDNRAALKEALDILAGDGLSLVDVAK
jgi:hypothetical protein